MGKLSSEQRKSLEIATLRYMDNIAPALPWLAKRGITEAIAKSRGLGLVKNPILGHGPMTGRLAIPYLTDAGPIAMNFRCLEDHDCKTVDKHSKYRKPAGMETGLYGVQSYFTDGMTMNITEGELDCIVLNDLVHLPAMGVPGSANWKDKWKLIFRDFDHIVIWADSDPAGDNMVKKFMKELGQTCKQVVLPQGEDVNSLYLKHGAGYLRSLVPK